MRRKSQDKCTKALWMALRWDSTVSKPAAAGSNLLARSAMLCGGLAQIDCKDQKGEALSKLQ